MRVATLMLLLLTFGFSSDSLNHLGGRWMVSGSLSYYSTEDEIEGETSYQSELTLGPTYFARDYLGLNIDGLVATQRGDYFKQESYGITPSIVLVFPFSLGQSEKPIYPYVKIGYNFSEIYMYREKYFTNEGVRLETGIFLFMNKNVAIRPYYSYSETSGEFPKYSSSTRKFKRKVNGTGISLAIFF